MTLYPHQGPYVTQGDHSCSVILPSNWLETRTTDPDANLGDLNSTLNLKPYVLCNPNLRDINPVAMMSVSGPGSKGKAARKAQEEAMVTGRSGG